MTGELAIKSFLQQKPKKERNTESTGDKLFLFGNCIAKWVNGVDIWISDGNYPLSMTTKSRLCQIGAKINTKKGIHYLNGYEWDGKWVDINYVPKKSLFDD